MKRKLARLAVIGTVVVAMVLAALYLVVSHDDKDRSGSAAPTTTISRQLGDIPQANYSDQVLGGLLKMKNVPTFYIAPSAVREGYDPVEQRLLVWLDLATQAFPVRDDAHPIAVAHLEGFGWWADGPCTLIFPMSAASDDISATADGGFRNLGLPSIPPDTVYWIAAAQAIGHSTHSGECD